MGLPTERRTVLPSSPGFLGSVLLGMLGDDLLRMTTSLGEMGQFARILGFNLMIFLGVMWVIDSGSEVVLYLVHSCIGRQPLKGLQEARRTGGQLTQPRQARATPASRGFQTPGPAGACLPYATPLCSTMMGREKKNPQRGRLRESACRTIPESHVHAKQRNKASRSRAPNKYRRSNTPELAEPAAAATGMAAPVVVMASRVRGDVREGKGRGPQPDDEEGVCLCCVSEGCCVNTYLYGDDAVKVSVCCLIEAELRTSAG